MCKPCKPFRAAYRTTNHLLREAPVIRHLRERTEARRLARDERLAQLEESFQGFDTLHDQFWAEWEARAITHLFGGDHDA